MSTFSRYFIRLARTIHPTLERCIPLPPIEKRRNGRGIFSIKKMCSIFWDVKRDGDYLSWTHLKTSIYTMLVIFTLVLSDAIFKTNMIVDNLRFSRNPIIIADAIRNIAFFPWIIITAAFYIRIRLSVDMMHGRTPMLIHPAILEVEAKDKFFMPSAIAIYMTMFFPLIGNYSVYGIVHYFDAYQSPLLIAVASFFYAVALGVFSWLLVASLLTAEKINHHFDDARSHFKQMIIERDSITDKYIKNQTRGHK